MCEFFLRRRQPSGPLNVGVSKSTGLDHREFLPLINLSLCRDRLRGLEEGLERDCGREWRGNQGIFTWDW